VSAVMNLRVKLQLLCGCVRIFWDWN